ncbi:hypothetical protein TTRE_0000269701 [Trichuris trichiura]|uniref:Uncharacterized protein n=1 Tax=Trichuris trichiura TaxID=36087 RepID=A0A077Z1Q7_TRITR|nr:hypothetical protein TTRE_0000269701 [Trichuris trichiura]
MAAYAQEVANNCSSLAPKDSKYPVAISVAENETSTNAFASISDIAFFYNFRTNLCDAFGEVVFTTEQCQNFRQFYRYEAHEVGCALSKCDKILPEKLPERQLVSGPFLWVCAFSSRAPPESPPYIPLAEGAPRCLMCPTQKSKCGYETKYLCCDDGWDNLVVPQGSQGTSTNPDSSNVTSSRVRVNVRLYRHIVKRTTVIAFEGLSNTVPNLTEYTDVGPFASVVKNGSSVRDCQGLKPIYQLYSELRRETTYASDERLIDNMLKNGYQRKEIIGQTVSQLRECNANKVVITCYGVDGLQTRVTNTTDENIIWKQLFPRYGFVRVNFLAWDPEGNSSATSDPKADSSQLKPAELSPQPSSQQSEVRLKLTNDGSVTLE